MQQGNDKQDQLMLAERGAGQRRDRRDTVDPIALISAVQGLQGVSPQRRHSDPGSPPPPFESFDKGHQGSSQSSLVGSERLCLVTATPPQLPTSPTHAARALQRLSPHEELRDSVSVRGEGEPRYIARMRRQGIEVYLQPLKAWRDAPQQSTEALFTFLDQLVLLSCWIPDESVENDALGEKLAIIFGRFDADAIDKSHEVFFQQSIAILEGMRRSSLDDSSMSVSSPCFQVFLSGLLASLRDLHRYLYPSGVAESSGDQDSSQSLTPGNTAITSAVMQAAEAWRKEDFLSPLIQLSQGQISEESQQRYLSDFIQAVFYLLEQGNGVGSVLGIEEIQALFLQTIAAKLPALKQWHALNETGLLRLYTLLENLLSQFDMYETEPFSELLDYFMPSEVVDVDAADHYETLLASCLSKVMIFCEALKTTLHHDDHSMVMTTAVTHALQSGLQPVMQKMLDAGNCGLGLGNIPVPMASASHNVSLSGSSLKASGTLSFAERYALLPKPWKILAATLATLAILTVCVGFCYAPHISIGLGLLGTLSFSQLVVAVGSMLFFFTGCAHTFHISQVKADPLAKGDRDSALSVLDRQSETRSPIRQGASVFSSSPSVLNEYSRRTVHTVVGYGLYSKNRGAGMARVDGIRSSCATPKARACRRLSLQFAENSSATGLSQHRALRP